MVGGAVASRFHSAQRTARLAPRRTVQPIDSSRAYPCSMVDAVSEGQWVVCAGHGFPDGTDLAVATPQIRVRPIREVAIEVRAVSFSPLLTVEAVVEQVDRILTEVQAGAMWTYHVAAEVVVTDVFRVAASGSYAWIPWEREATAPATSRSS